MSPLADINPKTDVDVDVQDSCNCVSSCCVPRGTFFKRKKKDVESKTSDLAKKVIMEEIVDIQPQEKLSRSSQGMTDIQECSE